MIATESRANIFDTTDPDKHPIAYFDDIQKVFPVGNTAIAETGQGLISNVFFSNIVQQFQNATQPTSVSKLLPEFIRFCQKTLPPGAFEEMRKQKLFSAGFENRAPKICYFNEGQPAGPFGCIESEGYIESAPTTFAGQRLKRMSLSADQAKSLAENAIREYAAAGDRWKTIGGPITSLLITPVGTRWINPPTASRHWEYIQDFIRDYRSGKVDVHLIPPATKLNLEDLLNAVK